MIASVSFLTTRSGNCDEGAGVWGRIRDPNKTSFFMSCQLSDELVVRAQARVAKAIGQAVRV
jgi:hypothetical protein